LQEHIGFADLKLDLQQPIKTSLSSFHKAKNSSGQLQVVETLGLEGFDDLVKKCG
jgi:hypothetical protein